MPFKSVTSVSYFPSMVAKSTIPNRFTTTQYCCRRANRHFLPPAYFLQDWVEADGEAVGVSLHFFDGRVVLITTTIIEI